MADRLILDFEKNEITWDTDAQTGTEICPDLAKRKMRILEAMGYGPIDLTKEVQAINAHVNGEISTEELLGILEQEE